MIPFYSKRNQVYPCFKDGMCVVEKHFRDLTDWEKECGVYSSLTGILPVPKSIHRSPGLLVLEYLPHPSFLALLEEQEKNGFDEDPWIALAKWLQDCSEKTGMLPTDTNLRNFLWDERNHCVYGIDFESYGPISVSDCGISLIAMLLSYDPCDTQIKKTAAGLIASYLKLDKSKITAACHSLRDRRAVKEPRRISGIILAGGKSRRMGQNKAELMLLGKPLIQWQIEKMQALGIKDIIISGESALRFPDTRIVRDEYPDRGPLGGLHACLKQAENPQCLVLGVDVPLVPSNALAHMMRAHGSGATVLRHPAGDEPLIGIYDSSIHHNIADLIRHSGAPVRSLSKQIEWNHFEYLGPEELLSNCNSPEDFSVICSLADRFAAFDIHL